MDRTQQQNGSECHHQGCHEMDSSGGGEKRTAETDLAKISRNKIEGGRLPDPAMGSSQAALEFTGEGLMCYLPQRGLYLCVFEAVRFAVIVFSDIPWSSPKSNLDILCSSHFIRSRRQKNTEFICPRATNLQICPRVRFV